MQSIFTARWKSSIAREGTAASCRGLRVVGGPSVCSRALSSWLGRHSHSQGTRASSAGFLHLCGSWLHPHVPWQRYQWDLGMPLGAALQGGSHHPETLASALPLSFGKAHTGVSRALGEKWRLAQHFKRGNRTTQVITGLSS